MSESVVCQNFDVAKFQHIGKSDMLEIQYIGISIIPVHQKFQSLEIPIYHNSSNFALLEMLVYQKV